MKGTWTPMKGTCPSCRGTDYVLGALCEDDWHFEKCAGCGETVPDSGPDYHSYHGTRFCSFCWDAMHWRTR